MGVMEEAILAAVNRFGTKGILDAIKAVRDACRKTINGLLYDDTMVVNTVASKQPAAFGDSAVRVYMPPITDTVPAEPIACALYNAKRPAIAFEDAAGKVRWYDLARVWMVVQDYDPELRVLPYGANHLVAYVGQTPVAIIKPLQVTDANDLTDVVVMEYDVTLRVPSCDEEFDALL